MKKRIFRRMAINAAIVLCIALFCVWQNNYLTCSEYTFESDKIGIELDGYRIVQISDLHNKKFGAEHGYIMSKIEKLRPDIIVITGDIADANHTDIDTAIEFVERAAELAPVYYVTGNHEFWLEESDRQRLISGIEGAGAVYLDNKSHTIERDGSAFELIGIGDRHLGGSTLRDMISRTDPARLNVVLAHEPEYMKNYSDSGAELVLSGHVHGGQFRLPFVGGIIAPGYGFFPEYTDGEYFMGDTTMIVSRGLGNSVVPLRLFNFPELVCVELRKRGS